jgi:hypothetical protein
MSKGCSTNEEKMNACTCRLMVGKREGKRPLGRPKRRSIYIINMDLREKAWGCVDWIGLTQDKDY